MKVTFPYPGYEQIDAVDIPDRSLMGVYVPCLAGELDQEAVLERGFAEPINAPRLRHAVDRDARVLILVDDSTRGTPVPRMLRHVLGELHVAGVPERAIRILTAQGTHREMTESELKEKLDAYYGRFEVYQHHWLDPASLHDFGVTKDGDAMEVALERQGSSASIAVLRNGGHILPLVCGMGPEAEDGQGDGTGRPRPQCC